MTRLLRAPLLFIALVAAWGAAADQAPLLHHEIDVRLDPESRALDATDAVTVNGRKKFRFALAPWLELEGLKLDGRAVEPEAADGTWTVRLPDIGRHEIELRYAGEIPALPAGGRRGFLPAAAGTEGTYLMASSGWIPESGDDWITYRLTVEVPAPHWAVATGRLEEETAGDAVYRASFVADYRAEPPSLFVGPYEVEERRAGNIRIRTYFHTELAELANDYLEDSARYLARYDEQIGAYPFQDFHVISAPIPVGLGFPNLTYIGQRVLALPFIRGSSLPHEVLHNWWGNGVAVDYASGNWSEGLTTYMADYTLAADRGAERAREMRLGWLRDYAALPEERDMPVTRFTSKSHDAAQVVGYNKVAFIFHMLKLEIGAPAFAQGLRLFWQRQRFQVAGWRDLQAAFEETSGQRFDRFFEQWLTRRGAPEIALGDVEVEGRTVNLDLRQAGPAYRLTVPVVIETGAGEERHKVVIEGTEKSVRLDAEADVRAVRVDPGHDLFRRLLPGEAPPILRDVTLSSEAVTLIAAADDATAEVARELAARLLDTGLRREDDSAEARAPLLVIGTTAEVAAMLEGAGLDGVPESLVGRGTARVWTARRPNGEPMLAVAADDTEALQALLRPLPHYGRKSHLVFEGRRAVETGIWPATDSPLSRRFDG